MSFLSAGGHRLEYEWTGPGPKDGPALVFLHEGLGSVSMWRDFPAGVAAAAGLRALVYSRLGYGRSDPAALPRPIRYMHDEGLAALPAVLDAAGVDSAVLVGHSDGGSIALIHAGAESSANSDGRIRGVVTLAAHVFCEQISVDSIAAARVAWETTDLKQRLARHHDDVDAAFRGWNEVWLQPDFLAWNIEEYLPDIACPVLAIQGADDEYGSAAQLAAIEAGVGGPVKTLMLAACGHSPQRDQAEATRAAIVDFVAGLGLLERAAS